jgi:hypothetical protein
LVDGVIGIVGAVGVVGVEGSTGRVGVGITVIGDEELDATLELFEELEIGSSELTAVEISVSVVSITFLDVSDSRAVPV